MEELNALQAEVAQIDAQLAPAPEEAAPAAPQAAPNEVAELSALVQIISGLFVPMFPSLREIYTPQACDTLAAAAVPVMKKRGWSISQLLGNYAEEVALLAVAGPMAFATYQGVLADKAKAAQKTGVEPKADTVSQHQQAGEPKVEPRA